MRWVLCVLCLVVGCGKGDTSEKEVKGIYCAGGNCMPYEECQSVYDGSGLECEPIEDTTYCWRFDLDRGDGTEVECYTSMAMCKLSSTTDGPFAPREIKSCYTLSP